MANSEILRLMALLAVCIIPTVLSCGGWVNYWDAPLEFECPSPHQFVSHIESVHDNHREDRRYKMCCRRVPEFVRHSSTRCYWTGYLNNYDQLLMFNCGLDGYINGFRSVHSNHHEDRRWKVRCCKVRDLYLYECRHTGWTNNWDRYQNYNVPYGQIMNGVFSIHHNHYEDRRWKFLTCKSRRRRVTDVVDGIFSKLIEEGTTDESYSDTPVIEESSGDRRNTDMPAVFESD